MNAAYALWGIAAFAKDDMFSADALLFGVLSTWGAVFLALAATQALTALLLFTRSRLGALLGILIAALSGIAQLMAIKAYGFADE